MSKNQVPFSDRSWTIVGSLFTIVPVVWGWLDKNSFVMILFQSPVSTGLTFLVVTLVIVLLTVLQSNLRLKKEIGERDTKIKEVQALFVEAKELAEAYHKLDGQKENFIITATDIIQEVDVLLSFKGSKRSPIHKTDIDRIENRILACATNIALKSEVDVMTAMILTPTPDGKHLKISNMTLESRKDKSNPPLKINDSFAGDCYNLKKPVVSNCTATDSIDLHDLKNHERIKSIICMPIMLKDRVLGVFCITSQLSDAFKGPFVDYLKFFTKTLALVMRLRNVGSVVCERLVSKVIVKKGGTDHGMCRYEKSRSEKSQIG